MTYAKYGNVLRDGEDDKYYKEIFKVFILPLWKSKSVEWDRYEWLAWLFKTHQVIINTFKARRSFTLKDVKRLVTPKIYIIDSDKEYKVKTGNFIYLRYDVRSPDVYELEIQLVSGNYETFKLTKDQFETQVEHNLSKLKTEESK